MDFKQIGIIGAAGRLGRSLTQGLVAAGCNPSHIWTMDRSPLTSLSADFPGIMAVNNAMELLAHCDTCFICVKPKDAADLFQTLGAITPQRPILYFSTIAGLPLDNIEHWASLRLVRCMPNLALATQSSVTGLYPNARVTLEDRAYSEFIFGELGLFHWCTTEEQLNTLTALSGSGPAYFLFLMEAMEDWAIAQGLPATLVHECTMRTALGAASMAQHSKDSFHYLRECITSPGGTTAEAIRVFEEHHTYEHIAEALEAAQKKAEQLFK